MLEGQGWSAGASHPLNSLIEPLEIPERPLRFPGSQPSGGEKTTITRRSSVMWWNL